MTPDSASKADLLKTAERFGRNEAALRQDLASLLFPQSFVPIDEQRVVESRNFLRSAVGDIEAKLIAATDFAVDASDDHRRPRSWRPLATSGLLSDPKLLALADAMAIYKKMLGGWRKDGTGPALGHLARLAESPQNALADASLRAMAVIHADGASPERRGSEQLPAELFSLLCWRIVAALSSDGDDEARQKLSEQVPVLLGKHDEGKASFSIAQRLSYMLAAAKRSDALHVDPAAISPLLAVSNIAQASRLTVTQAFAIVADPVPARLAVAMKAAKIEDQQARALLGWVANHLSSVEQVAPVIESMTSLSSEACEAVVSRWRKPAESEPVEVEA